MTPPLRPVRWRLRRCGHLSERGPGVIVIGIDPHKQTHTAVAVDGSTGELLGELTVPARQAGHERLLGWARALAAERRFALEDGRHVSGSLERVLLARGETVVRVPPKLMAGARRSARERGKSDAIDAAAVARAALREPGLPLARVEGPTREIRLLLDHRGSGRGADADPAAAALASARPRPGARDPRRRARPARLAGAPGPPARAAGAECAGADLPRAGRALP